MRIKIYVLFVIFYVKNVKKIFKENKNEINNKKCDVNMVIIQFIMNLFLILIQNKFWPIQLINLLFENKIFRNIEILFLIHAKNYFFKRISFSKFIIKFYLFFN